MTRDPPVKAGGSRVLTWAVLPTSRPPVWRRRGRSRHFVLHSVVPAPEIPASSDILEYKAAAAARRAYEDLGAARCRPITSSRLVAGIVATARWAADVVRGRTAFASFLARHRPCYAATRLADTRVSRAFSLLSADSFDGPRLSYRGQPPALSGEANPAFHIALLYLGRHDLRPFNQRPLPVPGQRDSSRHFPRRS